jgi:hypothetical protein
VARIAKACNRPTDTDSLRKLRYLLLEQWRHETNRSPMFVRSYDGVHRMADRAGGDALCMTNLNGCASETRAFAAP